MRDSYDLHTHSRASDGLLAPADLVKQAAVALAGFALTDHDTIAGLDEAEAAAERLGVSLVPGVELTTDYGSFEVHILAYFVDRRHPVLVNRLERIVQDRIGRAQGIVAKLASLGYPVPWEAVLRQTPGTTVGRPHIMRALIEAGLVKQEHADAFFREYLISGAPAFVPHQELTTAEAIELAAAAGGVPVLAHPGRLGSDDMIKPLVEWGIRGMEVNYPSHTPAEAFQYARVCAKYGLIPTGGSDFHGEPDGPKLGQARAGLKSVADLAGLAASKAGKLFLAALHIPESDRKK